MKETLFILLLSSVLYGIDREQAINNAMNYVNEEWTVNKGHVNQFESATFNTWGPTSNPNFWFSYLVSPDIIGVPYAFGGKHTLTQFRTEIAKGELPSQELGPKTYISDLITLYGGESVDIPDAPYLTVGRSADVNDCPVTIEILEFSGYLMWYMDIFLQKVYYVATTSPPYQVNRWEYTVSSGQYIHGTPPTQPAIEYQNDVTQKFRVHIVFQAPGHIQTQFKVKIIYPSEFPQDFTSPGWNKIHFDNFGICYGNHPANGGSLFFIWYPSWGTGIDCSGLVSRSWELENFNQANSKWFYLNWPQIESEEAQAGDIIINEDTNHVVIFQEYNPNTQTIKVIEAIGLSGDNQCVINNYASNYFTGWTYHINPALQEQILVSNSDISDEPSVFPNPFNAISTIQFQVVNPTFVKVQIFNNIGQLVSLLVSETLLPGKYSYKWNALNYASGMYFLRFEANGNVFTKKILLLK